MLQTESTRLSSAWAPPAPSVPKYARRPPLVLVNGLAEQAESWFRNVPAWSESYSVHQPNLLAYRGDALHRRIGSGEPVDVEWLVGRLHAYLTEFVDAPPYRIVANSLGGKVAVELAIRRPDLVERLVLLCPSGLGDEERLPLVEGVRKGDPLSMVGSVFHDPACGDVGLFDYYRGCFGDRRWKTGLLRTVRGTSPHRVGHLLPQLRMPTLLVVGREDRIVEPKWSLAAAEGAAFVQVRILDGCGHAPQIEQAEVVNRLTLDFLAGPAIVPSPAPSS